MGYSRIKTLISLKIYMKTPNTRDFHHKNSQSECFYAEYTENLGYSMRLFRKIGNIAFISIKLTIKPNNLGRKLRKLDFSLKQVQIFAKIISTNNYMWIYISKIAKTIVFSTQTEVETFHKLFFCKTIHNYCRKHRKFTKFIILHNRMQISEKFSPMSQKLAFSQVPHQLFFIQSANCSHANYQKQQLTAHTSIVKRYTAKCYKHTPISSKHTIVVTGVSKSTNIHAQNTKQTNLAHIIITI